MERRLIDANALAKWLDKEHYINKPTDKCDERQNKVLCIVLRALQNTQVTPTIEAEPVRHGRWVPVSLIDHKGRVLMEQYKCSECGRLENNKQPYCHCGCKMDGITVKPEECRYFTKNALGARCLGTKEIDPCEGKDCKRYKPKEDGHD